MTKETEPDETLVTDVTPIQEEDHEHDESHDDEHHVSLAARSLQILAILAAGAIFGLWAGPRIAPHLPEGMAPVAEWLSPQTNASTEALGQLRAETEARLATLETGLKREEIEARLANFQTDIVNPLRDQMSALSDQMAAADTTAVEARLWAVEGRVEGLVAELESLRASLGSMAEEGGTISADTAASIAAYRTRIDALQSQVDEITARQGELTHAMSAVAANTSQQVEEAQQLVEEASETALTMQKRVALASAITEMETALQTGASFGETLSVIAEISGAEVPPELRTTENGIPTLELLEQEFPLVAHAGIRADIAGTQDSGLSGIGSFFRSQVATRSLTPQEGDSADAVLSRMEAALKLDDLAGVQSEAEGLSEPALGELEIWLGQVQARAAAIHAFETWRGALEAGEQ